MKRAYRNAIIMVVLAGLGITQFMEGVRAVQVLGLAASGALFGVALATFLIALKSGIRGE